MEGKLELLVSMGLHELEQRADKLIDDIKAKASQRPSLQQQKEELKFALSNRESLLYLNLDEKLTLKKKEVLLNQALSEDEEYRKLLKAKHEVEGKLTTLSIEEEHIERRLGLCLAVIRLRSAQLNFLAGEEVKNE